MKYRKKKEEDFTNKPTRFFSDRQEERVASDIGGRKTKNSGATMWQKGDILEEDWIIECKTKTTDSKSFTIKKEWLEKNKAESINENKQFCALAFNFGPHDKEDYYIIDKQTFLLVKDILKQLKDND